MTDSDIKAGLALCEAATAGPWEVERRDEDAQYVANMGQRVIMKRDRDGFWLEQTGPVAPGDAAFIAAARTLLPEALRALQVERECLEARNAQIPGLVEKSVVQEAELERLRKLVDYADHTNLCRRSLSGENPCDCGYNDARAALEDA